MKTDIEIAKEAVMKPIGEVAEKLGISLDELELYGKYKAKLSDELWDRIKDNEDGKLILVTAINPTPAGEGKTTVTVGLGEAFERLGKKAVIALREPSLGPCFGVKGGAAGGGYAQVVPMEDLNLHFTGDFHAITSANNLLSALLDNHIKQGNALGIDTNQIVWKRCLDMNDRVLRNVVVGLGSSADGVVREDHFVITVASEIMAVLCLANDMKDLKDIKCYLLDMDGTIYLGNELIDGAKEFLEKLKEKNIRYIFLTNNSSKNKDKYVEKLNKLGIEAHREDVFSSGEATTIYLSKKKKGAKVFLLGTKDLEDEFEKAGFELVRERNKDIDFVVLGFDTTLTYEKLWIACEYIANGVEYIATHPDFNCPLENGKFMPDAGAMMAFIKASTGKEPTVIGKPNRHIIDAIIEKYDLKKSELAMVGDRLYTDIRTGIDNGLTSILVMSGETDKKMLKETIFVPDFVFESVKEIKETIE